MSRLVINKGVDRTICIIKNFGSIELSENEIKIIDKHGLISSSIFQIKRDDVWGVSTMSFSITSSNMYRIAFHNHKKIWYISPRALEDIISLITEYYDVCLANAVREKVLNLDNFSLSILDDLTCFKCGDISVIDEYNMYKPSIYYTNETSFLGNNTFIYVALDNVKNIVFESLHNGPVFPNSIYILHIKPEYFHTLEKFITNVRVSPQIPESTI